MAKEMRDFGEKIGGARKDFYRTALNVGDLESMNEAERQKFVKKDNIWKKYDEVAQVESGVPQGLAYWKNEIRKSLPATAAKCDPAYYVEIIGNIRDLVDGVKKPEDIGTLKEFLLEHYLVSSGKYRYSTTPEARGIITNNLFAASQHSYSEFEVKARLSMYGVPKEKRAEVYLRKNILIYEIGKNVFFGKDFLGRTMITLERPGQKCFYYPKEGSEFANKDSWIKGRFAVLREDTHQILSNSEKSLEGAMAFSNRYVEATLAQEKEVTSVKKKKGKRKFPIPEIAYAPRTGPKYRISEDVSGEDMMETFKIRGGEFGNWLHDADARESLKKSYDAFQDLARILDIEPEDISNGGTLAIAFGARGKGGMNAAAAHYEPERLVINLTRNNGAGCLCHEYAHSLDDRIGKLCGLPVESSATMASQASIKDRKLLPQSFLDVMDAILHKPVDKKEWTKAKETAIEQSKKRFYRAVSLYCPREMTPEQEKGWNAAVDKAWESKEEMRPCCYMHLAGMKDLVHPEIEALSDLRKSISKKAIRKDGKKELADIIYRASCRMQEIKRGPEGIKDDSNYVKNSQRFDMEFSKASHGYWASNCELFARAFDCYVADKLRKEGNTNQYLTAYADSYVIEKDGVRYSAIPKGEERILIFQKIDTLLEDLKARGWHTRRSSDHVVKDIPKAAVHLAANTASDAVISFKISADGQMSFA